jgi:hypothetical protein
VVDVGATVDELEGTDRLACQLDDGLRA